MIGIAFTGSGKTLSFSLPAILLAMEQEVKMPFQRGEGPYSVVLCPSRELARQTFDTVQEYVGVLQKGGAPKLNTVLCMGGVDMREQLRECNNIMHIAVCTPGRLIDMLTKKKFSLHVCRFFCMDEADRMIDLGFEEDIRTIFSFFSGQRQTVLYSATMPTKIRDFAQSALVDPITVNVGRAGAASLDVVQEVEYVRPEAKIVYLLECLQKTPPPVMIFSEKKSDVDDIHEFLLQKGSFQCARACVKAFEGEGVTGGKRGGERKDGREGWGGVREAKKVSREKQAARRCALLSLHLSLLLFRLNFGFCLLCY